jgi:hypothetical protein
METLFSNINTTPITTGIISQTTLGNIPRERLTGNLQSETETVAPALFNQVLTTLNDANLGQSYTAYSMARDNFKSAVASGAAVPIVLLDFFYDEFRQ